MSARPRGPLRHAAFGLQKSRTFPLKKCIRTYVQNGQLIILVLDWRKLIHRWRRYARKTIFCRSRKPSFLPSPTHFLPPSFSLPSIPFPSLVLEAESGSGIAPLGNVLKFRSCRLVLAHFHHLFRLFRRKKILKIIYFGRNAWSG